MNPPSTLERQRGFNSIELSLTIDLNLDSPDNSNTSPLHSLSKYATTHTQHSNTPAHHPHNGTHLHLARELQTTNASIIPFQEPAHLAAAAAAACALTLTNNPLTPLLPVFRLSRIAHCLRQHNRPPCIPQTSRRPCHRHPPPRRRRPRRQSRQCPSLKHSRRWRRRQQLNHAQAVHRREPRTQG